MEGLPSPSYFERLPYELSCMILNRLTIADLLRLYPIPRWRAIFDLCPRLGAGKQEAVHIPLETLLAWPWTRNITYVLTDFPLEEEQWPALLEALKGQPVLAINLPYTRLDDIDKFRRLGEMAQPPPNGKRIVVHTGATYMDYSVADMFEGNTYYVRHDRAVRDTVVRRNGENVSLGGGRVLSRLGYDIFANADLGLADPGRPPGPDNPPLRDVLTMFSTYVVAVPTYLYLIVRFLARVQQARGLEGNWIWLAPYFEKIRGKPPFDDARQEDRRYLERFGVPVTRRLLLTLRAGLFGWFPQSLQFSGAFTVMDAFAAEVPHPWSGLSFVESTEQDESYISYALSKYLDTSPIYLTNGEAVNTSDDFRNGVAAAMLG